MTVFSVSPSLIFSLSGVLGSGDCQTKFSLGKLLLECRVGGVVVGGVVVGAHDPVIVAVA